jgi:DNA-binding GntR family transcriptional regulator
LSFEEGLADNRPRSLASAVQQRLRADILSTRVLPDRRLPVVGLARQFSVSLAAVLCEQNARYRKLSIRDASGLRDVEAEHTAIAEAVFRRDTDAAVDALARHFTKTMHIVKATFAVRIFQEGRS